jgi:Flp pilus assembly protein TadG
MGEKYSRSRERRRRKADARKRDRRGVSAIYLVFAVVLLSAWASIAVDWGLVQLAKTELLYAADAAARSGAMGLLTSSSQAQSDAIATAALNTCNNSPVVLTASDIDIGTWDTSTRTFTVGGSSPNAVRVHASRTSAKGNAIPLTFARVLGINSCNANATAIAMVNPGGYGVVGLNYIKMSGNSSDSYWSGSGYSSGGEMGAIASNGNITLSGSSSIHGDAHPGVGKSVTGGTVDGSKSQLTTPLSYANGNAGSASSVNDNAQLGSSLSGAKDLSLSGNQARSFPGGTYYVHDFSVSSSASITFTGPTIIYCYHNLSFSGSATTASSLPKNLQIVLCPDTSGHAPGDVNVSGSSALYADIYAPQSKVNISGSGDLYGRVVGQSVDMSGTAAIHYDISLTSSGSVVWSVK